MTVESERVAEMYSGLWYLLPLVHEQRLDEQISDVLQNSTNPSLVQKVLSTSRETETYARRCACV